MGNKEYKTSEEVKQRAEEAIGHSFKEIFECYDSRGKNAMFASWGPQKGNIQKSTGK